MKPETRRQQIVSLLNQSKNGLLLTPTLSQMLGVSEMTIRRDLEVLEEQAQVRKIYGGAISLRGVEEKPYNERAEQFNPQKVAIGRIAASLVQEGQSIYLDSGTTTRQIAYHIREKQNITVVTNNIPISNDLGQYPLIKTYLLGGQVKHHELCTVGFSVRQALESFRVDTAFLGAASFSNYQGIMDIDMNELETKQTAIRIAREVILVADSRKYNQAALLRVAPLSAVQKIITDNDFPKDAIHEIEAQGIQVITPEWYSNQ